MRRAATSVLVGLLALTAACGSGQSPVIEGVGGTTSTTATAAPGDPGATAPGDTSGGAVATGGDATTGGAPGGDGEAPAGGGGDQPTDPASGGPALAFAPPAPGTYTFHTTGTASGGGLLGGGQQQIDRNDDTVIALLSADTVRQTQTSDEGSTVTDLRYGDSQVALLLLELGLGGQTIRFSSATGVEFAPVPPTAGQSWSWELTDESGQLTAAFSGTTAPIEQITVAGGAVDAYVVDAVIHITGTFSGFPIDATVTVRSWIDPALRTTVRSHETSTVTQPVQSSADTTSELLSFTPA